MNKRGKKTGEGYRSVMVEMKLMVAHIHEREDNRATGKTHNQTHADRTERTERTKGEKKQRGETHNPKAYAHADHNQKIKPDPQSEITIHSTCSPTNFIFIIFENGGKGSLFCNGRKRSRFYLAQPNDASLGGRNLLSL